MKHEFDAKMIVGNGFPPNEGIRLAEKLLADDVDWEHLSVDLRKLPPSLLISAFFNAFLQQIYTKNSVLLDKARHTNWEVAFDFQKANVARWMRDFEPYTGQGSQN